MSEQDIWSSRPFPYNASSSIHCLSPGGLPLSFYPHSLLRFLQVEGLTLFLFGAFTKVRKQSAVKETLCFLWEAHRSVKPEGGHHGAEQEAVRDKHWEGTLLI